ncbi:hypothetical protein GCK32_010703 [Trichostrongylus colubriformis]|uniref:Uncharacterized protein n=1 Tax=Trichostrongylus colubriformis TaxID=6319 RepID=A0AAN8IKZ3_TRICO
MALLSALADAALVRLLVCCGVQYVECIILQCVALEYVPIPVLGICMVMFTISALIMFLLLLRRNQRRYNRLVLAPAISNETTMQYTLSLRFQLEENIRSMKLLRNLLVLCTTMHIICFALLCGARIEWMHFYCDLIACYYDAVFNLTISIYAILIPFVAYCSGNIYRTLTRSIPIFGRLFRDSKVTSARKADEEGDVYFTNLNKQWG